MRLVLPCTHHTYTMNSYMHDDKETSPSAEHYVSRYLYFVYMQICMHANNDACPSMHSICSREHKHDSDALESMSAANIVLLLSQRIQADTDTQAHAQR